MLVLPCIEGRVEHATVFAQATLYGSVLPAAWSLMLALRARGLGTAWTSDHLIFESEVAALLGIPALVTQAALLAVAFFTGKDFRPAARRPAREVMHWDGWERLSSRGRRGSAPGACHARRRSRADESSPPRARAAARARPPPRPPPRTA